MFGGEQDVKISVTLLVWDTDSVVKWITNTDENEDISILLGSCLDLLSFSEIGFCEEK